ncbi:L,D-transpeptidase [Paenibacillus sp. NPDC058071]|uniref:L,D-transpeptidase n=1 Tax=Paenibacillus sp. NPDC058071 TaxID=3346326 RepID=UPI0036DEE360
MEMETHAETLYLKHYVNQHPDNQMAWYLLGKQYMMQGKEGKANYCFLQAGKIYDAYERKRHPLADGQPQQVLEQWNARQRRKRLAQRVAGLAVLLLLLVVALPGGQDDSTETADAPQIIAWIRPQFGVVLVRPQEREQVGKAWSAMLAWPRQPVLAVAARLEEEDGWRKWTGSKRLVMSVERENEAAPLQVRMYDRGACNCVPMDDRQLQSKLTEWAQKQETRWTLSSAIFQYNRLYGKWPERLDQLTQPYPRNVLSGDSSEMKRMFAPLLAAVKADAAERAAEGGKKGSEGKPPLSVSAITEGEEAVHGSWRKPLEIVIDKATHQLAVVSGDIVVRSYPVGLGGDETPEGLFQISEKVRNPNGRDDGEFGSRGMALSNTLYAIHGTDEPDSIGKDESHGCIRMGRKDVEELYDLVPLGTAVTIKNGTLPSKQQAPAKRFKLAPQANETNPDKVYRWLN